MLPSSTKLKFIIGNLFNLFLIFFVAKKIGILKKKINIAFSTLEADFVTFPDDSQNDSFLSFSIDLNKTLNEINLAYKNVLLFSVSNICSGFECENYVSARDGR